MPQLKQAERKKKNIQPSLPFCSAGAVRGLAEAQARWRGPASVLSPPIQMLISSRNTITGTLRNVYPPLGVLRPSSADILNQASQLVM